MKKALKSIRVKLFLTISSVILAMILFLIVVNNFVFVQFFLFSKTKTLKSAYMIINELYKNENSEQLETKLEQISIKNDFDILVKNNQNVNIYISNKDFFSTLIQIDDLENKHINENRRITEKNDKYIIERIEDNKTNFKYILLSAKLDNGYFLYIRVPINSVEESVKISNNFLYLMAGFTILISAVIALYVSRKLTDPILELNEIAKRMSNLDFSHKYSIQDVSEEVNDLGISINIMSEKLENTINQLRETNIELEKDIEEKSKIDEMRKSFISDVSHELKTPIALIEGYSEGLLENVNSDEESRKYYAEVILDETNKMGKLVKQLLELMKLEYGKREFNDKVFDLIELEKEVIRKHNVMIEEKNAKIKFETPKEIQVFADDFYIEQVITNYLTNAIKHVEEVNGEKYISITNTINEKNNKVRMVVFNTGKNISKEDISRIWNRFYKVDESRNREDGGNGIGLSFVKAIMNNYENNYGVNNKENGVEFYIELDIKDKEG